jgi:hypothetical protein
MDFMFLYPLIGGIIIKIVTMFAVRNNSYGSNRVGVNLYNSGLATLTCGALLQGIVDIAGTDSVYISWFFVTGWIMVSCGTVGICWRISKKTT